jgi:hypothetical protein
MSLDEKTEELLTQIRKKCRDRGWFGADAWMDPGFSNPPPFRTTFPDVATKEQLENVEQQLGFPLPRLLRDLYLHLANGEVGFGYGILPGEQLLAEYRSICEGTCFDGAWHWPKLLIPLCYWGDTLYSYLDIERGIILFADTEGLFDEEGDFLVEAPSLLVWLDRWVTKQDQYPSLTQQGEGDGTDREELEDFDDEEDPQARAMGLEKLEDDPHTPIPSYVREYRRLSRL